LRDLLTDASAQARWTRLNTEDHEPDGQCTARSAPRPSGLPSSKRPASSQPGNAGTQAASPPETDEPAGSPRARVPQTEDQVKVTERQHARMGPWRDHVYEMARETHPPPTPPISFTFYCLSRLASQSFPAAPSTPRDARFSRRFTGWPQKRSVVNPAGVDVVGTCRDVHPQNRLPVRLPGECLVACIRCSVCPPFTVPNFSPSVWSLSSFHLSICIR